MKSPRPDEESNFKSHFHLNAFYFPSGDSQKDDGLEIEFLLDTGVACSIINNRTFLKIAHIKQPITVVRSDQKTKTDNGDIVPMNGHTTLSFSSDSDGEHQFQIRIWNTETDVKLTCNRNWPTICLEIAFRITCNRAQNYSERYLLMKIVFHKTLSFRLKDAHYQDTPPDPDRCQNLQSLELLVGR